MKAHAYLRYSPRPEYNDETGKPVKPFSNEEQLALITAGLARQSHQISGEPFQDENRSRDDLDRESLWDAVEACQKGELLAVYDLDRVGDLLAVELTMYRLRKRGAFLWTYTGGIEKDGRDDQLLRGVKGLMAGHEKGKNAERTRNTMLTLQARGVAVGGNPPFGKKIVFGGRHPRRGTPIKLLADDPIEQRAIAIILELWNLGNKSSAIKRILEDDGVQGFRGKGWSCTTILEIVKQQGSLLQETTSTPQPALCQ